MTSEVTDDRVREQLHCAIHRASREYFTWSGGNILYDKGVESLMQVYSAQGCSPSLANDTNKTRPYSECAQRASPGIGRTY